jgi:hypothetical protein
MNWIKVKEKLPIEDKQLVIFIQYKEEWNTCICYYIGKWEDVKYFRKYDLENNYNYWMPFISPDNA